jgi:hypothetical protein
MRAPIRTIVLGLLVANFIVAMPPALASDGELRPVAFRPIMTPVATTVQASITIDPAAALDPADTEIRVSGTDGDDKEFIRDSFVFTTFAR